MTGLLRSLAVGQVDPNTIGVPRVDLNDNTLANIVSAVFVLIGALAVFFLLVGAARYVSANGEPPKIAQAKNTILYAIVGLVVSSLGFTIVQFILGRLTGNLQ
jgi:hypothetical protein